MKYMTPALLVRSRSQDATVAEAAMAKWEEACERYNRHTEAIQASLPPAARRLMSPRFNLHDARVLTIAVDDTPVLSILLERDRGSQPPDRHLELRYRLAGTPGTALELTKHPALASDGKPYGWWLY